MKNNFLKFGFMLLFATAVLACEKEFIENNETTTSGDSISIISDSVTVQKSKFIENINPEAYFGEWKLKHAYYEGVDYYGDSTLMLIYELKFMVTPSQYGGTTAVITRVDRPNSLWIVKAQHWKILNNDLVFYNSYGDWFNKDKYFNNHFTLLQPKVTNTTIDCHFYDKSGPAYKYTRKIHCIFTKVKDY